jgi:hypothetical protein
MSLKKIYFKLLKIARYGNWFHDESIDITSMLNTFFTLT